MAGLLGRSNDTRRIVCPQIDDLLELVSVFLTTLLDVVERA
jgi:hypothetical protein